MKKEELMIGDYCRCGNTVVKITRIDDHSASGIELHGLGPIRLTDDLLLKNGWTKRNGLLSTNPIFFKNEDCKEFVLTKREEKFFVDVNIGIMEIAYVHELQHFLRVCGMNDDMNVTLEEERDSDDLIRLHYYSNLNYFPKFPDNSYYSSDIEKVVKEIRNLLKQPNSGISKIVIENNLYGGDALTIACPQNILELE